MQSREFKLIDFDEILRQGNMSESILGLAKADQDIELEVTKSSLWDRIKWILSPQRSGRQKELFWSLDIEKLLNSIGFHKCSFRNRQKLIFRKYKSSSINDENTSIIFPVKNEEGHIEPGIRELRTTFPHCEIIIVVADSTDRSELVSAKMSEIFDQVLSVEQTGKGKFQAVDQGIRIASREYIIVIDSDLAVPVSSIRDAVSHMQVLKANFINCSRLQYGFDPRAMPLPNRVANYGFALLFRLIGITVHDTLCGTKIFPKQDFFDWKKEFDDLVKLDIFGDFFFLSGAYLSGMHIREFPVVYQPRTYGTSNISKINGLFRLLRFYCQLLVISMKNK